MKKIFYIFSFYHTFSHESGIDVGVARGRNRKLDLSQLEKVENCITEKALSLQAMDFDEIKEMLQKQLLIKNRLNSNTSLDMVPIDDKTVRKYMQEIGASDRKGKTKPKSRAEPFENIRNSISKAAGMTAIEKVCRLENIHSEDEVGIYLFGWTLDKKPKLFSTKDADAFLKKNNISLSSIDEQLNQERVAHIGATVQAHTGNLSCYYIRIVDSNFPDDFKTNEPTVRKPKIFLVDKVDRFYVVTCRPEVTDTDVQEYIGKIITHPAIFAIQEAIIQREIDGEEASVQYDSQSQPSYPLSQSNTIKKTDEGIKYIF